MKMREFKINANECNIDSSTYGISCLCAFGTHINGGWCALLTYGVSAELVSDVNAVGENRERIFAALSHASVGKEWLPKGKELKLYAQELSEVITKNIHGIEKTQEKKTIMIR